jgi:hypothetical protein
MTDIVTIAILAALPPTLLGVATLLQSFGNRNALTDNRKELKETTDAVKEVHVSLNSRLSELLSASHAEGRQQERDEVRRDKRMTDPNETHQQAPVSPQDELNRQQVHQHETPVVEEKKDELTLVDKAPLSQVTEEDKEKAEEKADKHHKNKKKKKHL